MIVRVEDASTRSYVAPIYLAMFSLKLQGAVHRIQQLVDVFLSGGKFPGLPQLAVSGTGSPSFFGPQSSSESGQSFLDTLKDGFLWGVPKKRKSLEKRRKKQFTKHYMDPFKLRTDLIVCLHCGHYHAARTICGHCYSQVKAETKLIHEQMDIKARTEDQQEVVVLYDGEAADLVTTHGKRVVEMPKKRPLWFSSNLLTKVVPKTTEQ